MKRYYFTDSQQVRALLESFVGIDDLPATNDDLASKTSSISLNKQVPSETTVGPGAASV